MSYLNTTCRNCGGWITVHKQGQECPHCKFPWGMSHVLNEGLLGLRRDQPRRSMKARLLSGD